MPPTSARKPPNRNLDKDQVQQYEDSPVTSLPRSIKSAVSVLTDERWFSTVALLLLVAESLFCLFIIQFVKYTEIDYSTYMQQVRMFLNGERDYSRIHGDSGPIVYPAGFLYIYAALYAVTDKGRDLRTAQYIFAAIYVATMALVFGIFRRSAILDSSPALRFQATAFSLRASLALSVKMNLLLFLPGLVFVWTTSLGFIQLLGHLTAVALVQLVVALPFASSSSGLSTYFSTSFNFSREFLWEWTVNWRWLGQAAFESPELSGLLLIVHLIVLIFFGSSWSDRSGKPVFDLVREAITKPFQAPLCQPLSADSLCVILFTSNLVGILCSRSLHYQFYTWYAHQVAFLLWHTPYDVYQRLGIFAAVEFGWEKFPSTQESSLGLTFANAFMLVGVYYDEPRTFLDRRVQMADSVDRKKM
ncbi:dolichyl-P-Man:Man(5)GlcNAc(2)-PP-dolichol alpha-1,3-mannosyltransferase [Microbotryomycetes sp. JL201]|nr:dolichyl-P-Man:Man(5)GlcNAc(2)-PP-dolichol alpha-1,3-mannosyltransferase [Microbotryomycetes sp. JL201]